MKKTIITMLLIVAGVFLVSCVKNDDNNGTKPDPEIPQIDESTKILVNNGQSDYVIVHPKNPDSHIVTAVNELKFFFQTATGAELDTMADDGLVHEDNNKYISIGNTNLLSDVNIKPSYDELGESGFIIKLIDDSIYITGNTDLSTLYGVYGFLEYQFDFEVYAVDEIYIKTNIKKMNVLDFDLKELPSFDYRLGSYGELWYGTTFTRRMKMHTSKDIWISLGGNTYHNFYSVVNPDIYEKDHPEWFSNGQLALMTDPDGIKEVVVNMMKTYINNTPNASLITFTQEDYNKWSEAPESKRLRGIYGTDAAEMILFINLVAEEIEEWMKEAHPGRNVTIAIFAYHKTEQAPTVWDENKNDYVPIDESMKLRSNVAVIYAPIFASHYYDYYHEENVVVAETMKKWSALTDSLFVWSYGTYFPYYFVPYDNFNSIQGKYQFALENNAKYMFDQGQFNQSIGTDWFRLKQYLTAKLQWNAYQDMDVLIDNFFTNYFKDAKEPMMNYYNSYRTWYAHIAKEMAVTGYVSGTGMLNQLYWPRGVLLEWESYINDALESIEHLKQSDLSLYNTLKDRITLESISIRFLLLQFYTMFYTTEEIETKNKEFLRDINNLGIAQYSEMVSVREFFE